MKGRKFRTFREAIAAVDCPSARHALRNFNFMNSGQPPSVGKLAAELGFDVEFREMPDSVSGLLESDPFAANGFRIVVNAAHPRTRQRWTALHEIAHYFLHPRYRDPFAAPHRAQLGGNEHFYASDYELEEEREANAWIEAIIFEEAALSAARSLFGADEQQLARHFGVSILALRRALKARG